MLLNTVSLEREDNNESRIAELRWVSVEVGRDQSSTYLAVLDLCAPVFQSLLCASSETAHRGIQILLWVDTGVGVGGCRFWSRVSLFQRGAVTDPSMSLVRPTRAETVEPFGGRRVWTIQGETNSSTGYNCWPSLRSNLRGAVTEHLGERTGCF